MRSSTLFEAIDEAHRFLKVANLLAVKLKEDAVQVEQCRASGKKFCFPQDFGKESSAVKRASMDLTRKLADLRQGR